MQRRQFVKSLGLVAVGGATVSGTASAMEPFPIPLDRGTTFRYAETDGENTEDEFIRGGKTFIHSFLPDDREFFLFTYTYGLGAFDDVVMVLSPETEAHCLTCVDGTTYDDAVSEGMVGRLSGLVEEDLFTEPLYEAKQAGVVDALQFSRRRLCRFSSALDPFYTFEQAGATQSGGGAGRGGGRGGGR